MSDRFTSAPEGWTLATAVQLKVATDQVWAAIDHEGTVNRTVSYYRRDGNFAGASFLDLDPADPYSFTPADLLSLNLMSVAAQPVAVRWLLEPSRERGQLVRLLARRTSLSTQTWQWPTRISSWPWQTCTRP